SFAHMPNVVPPALARCGHRSTPSGGRETGERNSLGAVAVKFVISGGGPAGNQAATHAARLGAEVTLIERDIVGGAAHLWDCSPSKAMIGTGGALTFIGRTPSMGLTKVNAELDFQALKERIGSI